jgi:DNA replication protein DnaC
MDAKITTGSQGITEIGRKLFPGFNLEDPARKSMYEGIFYSLTDNAKMSGFGLVKGKGILLVGNIGVGKSVMMRTMQVAFKDTPRRFRWINCLQFKDMLEQGMTGAEIKGQYGKALKCDLYIDDLGLGQADYRAFGNVTNIIAEILFERDELFVAEGFRTHLSSNMPTTVPKETPADKKSIERMYGDRILDRIIQMCNLITWAGKSLRRQNGI